MNRQCQCLHPFDNINGNEMRCKKPATYICIPYEAYYCNSCKHNVAEEICCVSLKDREKNDTA